MVFSCQTTTPSIFHLPSSIFLQIYSLFVSRENNMPHKTLFTLLLLFLISSTAVPTTRILKSSTLHHPSPQDFVFQDVGDLEISSGDSFELAEGRMVLENNDYPGTGANNHHDPKSPAAKP